MGRADTLMSWEEDKLHSSCDVHVQFNRKFWVHNFCCISVSGVWKLRVGIVGENKDLPLCCRLSLHCLSPASCLKDTFASRCLHALTELFEMDVSDNCAGADVVLFFRQHQLQFPCTQTRNTTKVMNFKTSYSWTAHALNQELYNSSLSTPGHDLTNHTSFQSLPTAGDIWLLPPPLSFLYLVCWNSRWAQHTFSERQTQFNSSFTTCFCSITHFSQKSFILHEPWAVLTSDLSS